MKTLFCIMAESGAGKTEVAKSLEQLNYKVIHSYTTRPPRKDNEYGHIFCSDEEYEVFKKNNEIAAYSLFNNYHYFTTKTQIMNSDIYVVDPDGIEDLKRNIKDVRFVTIYLNVDMGTRINRMTKRGDSLTTIANRLSVDAEKFANKKYDYCVPNDKLEKTYCVLDYILSLESDDSN